MQIELTELLILVHSHPKNVALGTRMDGSPSRLSNNTAESAILAVCDIFAEAWVKVSYDWLSSSCLYVCLCHLRSHYNRTQ